MALANDTYQMGITYVLGRKNAFGRRHGLDPRIDVGWINRMHDVFIRPARTDDVALLSALARRTYADGFAASLGPSDLAAHLCDNLSDATFAGAMDDGDTVLVAELEAGFVGFVQFGAARMKLAEPLPLAGEIRRLYVLADLQDKGIGSRLMDAALDHPRLKAAEAVYLDVWERNDRARRLYERYGFVVIGAHHPAYASGPAPDADLIMVRRRRSAGPYRQ
jgi:ribosomal protein S18 acetylase RimI-like enzyme